MRQRSVNKIAEQYKSAILKEDYETAGKIQKILNRVKNN